MVSVAAKERRAHQANTALQVHSELVLFSLRGGWREEVGRSSLLGWQVVSAGGDGGGEPGPIGLEQPAFLGGNKHHGKGDCFLVLTCYQLLPIRMLTAKIH